MVSKENKNNAEDDDDTDSEVDYDDDGEYEVMNRLIWWKLVTFNKELTGYNYFLFKYSHVLCFFWSTKSEVEFSVKIHEYFAVQELDTDAYNTPLDEENSLDVFVLFKESMHGWCTISSVKLSIIAIFRSGIEWADAVPADGRQFGWNAEETARYFGPGIERMTQSLINNQMKIRIV